MANDEFISVAAEIDLSAWSSHMATLTDDADLLDSLEDVDISATFDVDDSSLLDADELLNNLDTDVTPTIQTDSSDLLEADRLLDNMDSESVTPEIEADGSSVDEISSKLDTIKNLEIINTVWNIGGTAVDVLSKGVDFIAAPILEYDTALSQVQARTGNMIPNARELISDIFTDGWGESREQVGGVITLADQLGVSLDDIEAASRAAFTVSAVTGDDANTSLRTVVNTSKELGISYSEAADLIVAGTQDGANAAGDFQETLVEFGPKFREMKISGEGALAIIESGLDAGAKNAQTVADGIKELGTNIGKIGTDQGITEAFNKLDKLSDIDLSGLLDAYNEGKITGDEFYQGIFDALNDASAADPQAAQQIGATLIGSKSEDLGVGLFANLSTSFDATAQEIEGRADEAGTTIHDNITSKFTEVTRSIQDRIADYFENSTDFDTFLTNVKTGVQDAIDTLKSGGSLDEAITVGLKPLGFDDEFQKLESIFGNLVIQLLQIVAGIQDATGHGKEAEATRAEITRLGKQQLSFDLSVANPDDVANVLKTAADRGLKAADFGAAAKEAISGLLDSGDVEKAQNLLDAIKTGGSIQFDVTDPVARKLLEDQGMDTSITVPVSPDMTPEEVQTFIDEQKKTFADQGITLDAKIVPSTDPADIAELQKQIDDAVQAAKPPIDPTTGKDAFGVGFGAMGGNNIGAPGTSAAIAADDLKASIDDAARAYADAVVPAKDYHTQAELVTLANSDAGQSFAEMMAAAQLAATNTTDSMDDIGTSAGDMDASVTEAISGNTIIDEFDKMAAVAEEDSDITVKALKAIDDASFSHVEAHIEDMTYRLQLLAAQANATGAAIENAGTKAGGGGSGSGSDGNGNSGNSGTSPTSTSSLTLNQTNHIYSGAQSGSVAQQTADALGVGLG